jgi:hypothetical protein
MAGIESTVGTVDGEFITFPIISKGHNRSGNVNVYVHYTGGGGDATEISLTFAVKDENLPDEFYFLTELDESDEMIHLLWKINLNGAQYFQIPVGKSADEFQIRAQGIVGGTLIVDAIENCPFN